MATCLGKSCLFGLPSVSFVNVHKILCVFFFPFLVLRAGCKCKLALASILMET